jgi:hypothetical protein
MQAKELELKQAEEQRKANKDQSDAAEAAARLDIERERIASQERIASAQLLAKTEKDAMEVEIKRMQELSKMQQLTKPQTGKR